MASEKGIVEYIKNTADFEFTVNTAADDVGSVLTGTPLIIKSVAQSYFDAKDNVLIETVVVMLPYQFGIGDITPLIELEWTDPTVPADGAITQFGSAGQLLIPDAAVEYQVRAWVEFPGGANAKFAIRLGSNTGVNVSMVNAPAGFHTNVYKIPIFLKVRHTLPMIA